MRGRNLLITRLIRTIEVALVCRRPHVRPRPLQHRASRERVAVVLFVHCAPRAPTTHSQNFHSKIKHPLILILHGKRNHKSHNSFTLDVHKLTPPIRDLEWIYFNHSNHKHSIQAPKNTTITRQL